MCYRLIPTHVNYIVNPGIPCNPRLCMSFGFYMIKYIFTSPPPKVWGGGGQYTDMRQYVNTEGPNWAYSKTFRNRDHKSNYIGI